jgi:aminoglycoside phosphotransferase (APT) family kinase protein
MTEHAPSRPAESALALAPPPAAGVRLSWAEVPSLLRAQAESQLGARVVEAITQPGGFSPGVAARLRLADGRRAFVKAVGDRNPDAPGLHRAEARNAARLPAGTPAPRLLGSIDADGWVILLFEDVDGRMPAQPWQPGELARVLAAMTDLADGLTPAPIPAPPVDDRHLNIGQGWQRLADAHAAGTDDLAGLDRWARSNLDGLGAAEQRWGAAVAGDSLVHGDIRADNILLTSDGRVVFVDWPWASLGQPWFDLVGFLPSVRLNGGPPPETIFTSHPVAAGADPAGVTDVIAALAGMWTERSRQPDPPGLPTLRAFQRAHGVVALDWLKLRLGGEAAG